MLSFSLLLISFAVGWASGAATILILEIDLFIRTIERVFWPAPRRSLTGIIFFVGKERLFKMQMKDTQKLGPIVAVAADAKGVPVPDAKFDADPTWGLSDASMGQLVKDDAGALWLQPAAKIGSVKIQFAASLNGNAIAGESEDIVVVPGDAASVLIQVGQPV